ncbi:PTS sugar transporter subunit IIB [Clostridium sp. D2Q-14]|uniref:PTS sugar transporter subunit IIB n=1 Tax=Anaeromonas gelatinilytica TaxID=2683194 RepID=UPI00193B0323|nr:PTS sugar transporter subunit IIB [Anaeromonas gelatinilytica]MBS4535084.1 PTS sugar transporter subunit IIB [Anaeromonas gelatinilytica]
MKKVLVACGNGIATSTVVASKIKDRLADEGIQATITQCKLLEVPSKAEDYDLVVTTGNYVGKISTPIVGAISLLTGIGQEEIFEKILSYLK